MIDRAANNCDLLRLLAAWLVLFSHCYPIVGATKPDPFASWSGVDTLGGVGLSIFFTLSGYLVTQSFLRSTSLRDFLWRRARRIFPALILCVFICAFVIGPLVTRLSAEDYFAHPGTYQYLWSATAWEIQYALPGVFETNPVGSAVNGSLWSLPYEIRCYLFVVLLGVIPGELRWKALAVAIALLIMLGLRPLPEQLGVFDKFMGLNYYSTKLSLQFTIGALAALFMISASVRVYIVALAVVGSLLAAASTTLPHRGFVFSLCLPIVILATAFGANWLPKWPARWGDWSYGLFLWGFPVQQMIMSAGLGPSMGFIGFVVISTLLACILALCSWRVVEAPMTHLPLPAKT